MSELTNRLSPQQEIEIAREIERLFDLQDRPLSNGKKNHIVNELSQAGLPFMAIVAGIRDLHCEEIGKITIGVLFDSANKHVTYRSPDTFGSCRFCGRIGFVEMRSESGHLVSYPCTCDRGLAAANSQGLKPWNGKKHMHSDKYGILSLFRPDPATISVPEAEDAELVGVGAGADVNWSE